MSRSEEMCCFCLSTANISLTNLFTKGIDNSTHFDKISSSLHQLSNLLNENSNYLYEVCEKCCDNIDMVYRFNSSCLNSIKIFISNQKSVKVKKEVQDEEDKWNDERWKIQSETFIKTEKHADLPPSNNYSDISNICEEVIIKQEVEDEQSYSDTTQLSETREEERLVNYHDSEKLMSHPTSVNLKAEESFRSINNAGTLMEKNAKNVNYSELPRNGFNLSFVPKNLTKNKQNRFSCEECGKTFQHKCLLRYHARVHIKSYEYAGPFKCGICEKEFIHRGNYNNHMFVHMSDIQFKCDMCSKTFTQKSHLVRHKLIHTGEKPYPCDQCDQRFRQRANLLKHIRIHLGEKPYKCDVCGKDFSETSNLKIHRRTHTGEKPFSCDLCTTLFGNSSSLLRHKRNVHNLQ